MEDGNIKKKINIEQGKKDHKIWMSKFKTVKNSGGAIDIEKNGSKIVPCNNRVS